MRKVKLVLQILAAFIIAQLAFWGLYEPNSDAVKAILDKPSAVSAEQSNVPPSGSLKI